MIDVASPDFDYVSDDIHAQTQCISRITVLLGFFLCVCIDVYNYYPIVKYCVS